MQTVANNIFNKSSPNGGYTIDVAKVNFQFLSTF